MTAIKDNVNSNMELANTLTGGKLDSIKSSFSTKLTEAKNTVTNIFENIRSAIDEKMEAAKTVVSNAVQKLKDFFNFDWSLPKIKMPHFSISGGFSLNPPEAPHFSVDWYRTGGIMTNPTVFGMNGSSLMVGGEAGAEAILPLAGFYKALNTMLDKKLETVQQMTNVYIESYTYLDGDEISSRTETRGLDKMAINKKKGR